MTELPGARLDELFVRYWDSALTAVEADELARLLATDPVARDKFQFLCAQAVAVAELPVLSPVTNTRGAPGKTAAVARTGWSRRRVLALGTGLAAGVGGLVLGWWLRGERSSGVRLTTVQGQVTVRTADGRLLSGGRVPVGATVSTQGVGALAVLSFPSGSTVSLLGDSALTVGVGERELRLHQGTANADLRAETTDGLRLMTTLVTLVTVTGSVLTLGQGERATEVEVHTGRARATAPSGESLAVVFGGQLLTVGANGSAHQEPVRQAPEEFAWNLAEPLPVGWQVGIREVGSDGPVVRPDAWPDPYYDNAVMHQIRSDHQWTRGLFTAFDESVFVVKYRAQRACRRGQLCVCVRTPLSSASDTGVLEYNGGFEATRGAWRVLRVRAGDMLANKHAPAFGAPRVGFLVIVNTFDADIGLEIAELRVTRPGAR